MIFFGPPTPDITSITVVDNSIFILVLSAWWIEKEKA